MPAKAETKRPTGALEKYAALGVPRYTSFPTVPHFSQAVGPETQALWLSRLDPGAPISLYLHLPFCSQLCWYCGCNMKLAARYDPVAAYAGRLIEEIALVARHLPGRMTVEHLHWGGGTPTALSPEDLARVMAAVRAAFEIAPGAELAIESDPRTLTPEMTERIGALGFTRASFGVQEFDPRVQRAINRVQPPEMVATAVGGLRAAGVRAINFDLIYGLPHQTVESLSETVEICAAMAPDRLALFGYAHVPWMAKKQRLIPEAALPGAEARLAQADAAADRLSRLGYQAIGLDHFALAADPLASAAREGRLRRNFQGYTTDGAATLIGLGATSIGRTPSGYVQSISETGAWARSIAEGRLPVAKGHAFSGEDLPRAEAIEAIMCGRTADTGAIARAHGLAPDWCADAIERLAPMVADGLVEISGDRLRVREAGRPYLRVVAAAFDSYRAGASARHSVAV